MNVADDLERLGTLHRSGASAPPLPAPTYIAIMAASRLPTTRKR